jgi:large subunit ribosomal protein L1
MEKRVSESMSLTDAITFVKENAKAKFDESIEVHVHLNIDPKKGEQAVRGSVTLPHGIGKSVRVGVITEDKMDEAQKAGADVVGGQELIDKIKAGTLPDVDVLVATPDMMPKLAAAARILGPRGLMPSPKTDTVTSNVGEAVTSLKRGKSSFKNDNSGNVHQVIGKASFDAAKIAENFTAFIDSVKGCRNEAHKGQFITTTSVCSTMGPSVFIA